MELLFFAWRELRASLRARDSFGRYIAVDTRCAVAHVEVISKKRSISKRELARASWSPPRSLLNQEESGRNLTMLLYPKSFLIVWAAHSDKAAMVRVGFPVATVGNTPLPTRNRLGWSHDRCSELTTEFPLVVPMQ
jgi:hypothetical protein